MTALFDRSVFFDLVRDQPFGGALAQEQVDGMNAILDAWELAPLSDDLRWLAYPLATTQHETGETMQPIEEYGKGEGQPYGVPDTETAQTYFGRGFVQLTWRDNYRRADQELGLGGKGSPSSCEWKAANALDPQTAGLIMFRGMAGGWFRGSKLGDYFNDARDDPYNARDIINGDKSRVPDWSAGQSIGSLIANYHAAFLVALEAAAEAAPEAELPPGRAPAPVAPSETVIEIRLSITAAGPVTIKVDEAQIRT